MVASRTKLILAIFLSILLSIFGCIGLAKIAQKGSEGRAPVRGLTITIDVSRREELFARLREFAAKHSFTISIRKVEVIPDGVFIEMNRDDIEINAVSVPDAPTKIDLDFYEKNPSHPIQKEIIEALFNDLKSFVREIPNVTIIEER